MPLTSQAQKNVSRKYTPPSLVVLEVKLVRVFSRISIRFVIGYYYYMDFPRVSADGLNENTKAKDIDPSLLTIETLTYHICHVKAIILTAFYYKAAK